MAEKRQERNGKSSKRVPFRFTVKYGPHEPPEHLSFTDNVSESGIHIKTNKVFRPGTKIYMIITANEGTVKAEGIVKWAKKAPPSFARHVKIGMGIEFTKVDKDLLEIYFKKKDRT